MGLIVKGIGEKGGRWMRNEIYNWPSHNQVGYRPRQHIMEAFPNTAKAHSPAFNIAAIAMPLLGAVLGRAIVVGAPAGDAGWPHVLLGPLILPASGLLGIILSSVALIRRERYPWLSWVALCIAIVVVAYGASKVGDPNHQAALEGESPVLLVSSALGLAAGEPKRSVL